MVFAKFIKMLMMIVHQLDLFGPEFVALQINSSTYVCMYVWICCKILHYLKILRWTLTRSSKSSIFMATNSANTRVVIFQLGNIL